MKEYKLTQFSQGAGCGCKISPAVLEQILASDKKKESFDRLLVGSDTKDDAAVFNLDDKTGIISTTDFFMPIVDDAFDFGSIAATNAISDIYAMGGRPLMAIAILGWPLNKIPIEVAGTVLEGARHVCSEAGIPLAGGHSIDSLEPIFGLAVTGSVDVNAIKKNKDAVIGDLIYLTKPLGVGLVTTAQKRGIARVEDLEIATKAMLTLNKIGQELSGMTGVNAVTDVTGFGLGGHLVEICEASHCSATVGYDQIPKFNFVKHYMDLDCIPGGTKRNWQSYGNKIACDARFTTLIADPQTSGGLLMTISPDIQQSFEKFCAKHDLLLNPIGNIKEKTMGSSLVEIT